MRLTHLRGRLGCLLTTYLLVTGCGTTEPSRFYLLSAEVDAPAEPGPGVRDVGIGVGPIGFPAYLDRSQIVVRAAAGSELYVAESHRWAQSLADSFAEILAENLSRLTGSDHVRVYPWRRWERLRYQVVVEVTGFEARRSGPVTLAVRWRIDDGDGRELIEVRRGRYQSLPAGAEYAQLVTAHSEAIAALSAEVAAAILGLEERQTSR